MIMDEPTNNLGVPEQHKVLELIRTLKGRGVPVILITHVMPDALGVTDRIIVMHRGRKVAEKVTARTNAEELVQYMVGAREDAVGLGAAAERLHFWERDHPCPILATLSLSALAQPASLAPRRFGRVDSTPRSLKNPTRWRGLATALRSPSSPHRSRPLGLARSCDAEGLRALSIARAGHRISGGLRGKVRLETGLQRACSCGAASRAGVARGGERELANRADRRRRDGLGRLPA